MDDEHIRARLTTNQQICENKLISESSNVGTYIYQQLPLPASFPLRSPCSLTYSTNLRRSSRASKVQGVTESDSSHHMHRNLPALMTRKGHIHRLIGQMIHTVHAVKVQSHKNVLSFLPSHARARVLVRNVRNETKREYFMGGKKFLRHYDYESINERYSVGLAEYLCRPGGEKKTHHRFKTRRDR